jgi:hypothetical protein
MSKKGNSCFIKNINLGADFEADAAVQTLEEVKGGKNLTRLDIDSDEFDQIICQIVKLHLVSEFEKLNSKRDILKVSQFAIDVSAKHGCYIIDKLQQKKGKVSRHCTLKDFRINFVQKNWLVFAHFGLLEVAWKHLPEKQTCHGKDEGVAFELLQLIRITSWNHQGFKEESYLVARIVVQTDLECAVVRFSRAEHVQKIFVPVFAQNCFRWWTHDFPEEKWVKTQ